MLAKLCFARCTGLVVKPKRDGETKGDRMTVGCTTEAVFSSSSSSSFARNSGSMNNGRRC